MAHAAATRADTHRFSESFARGGVGQAGVELSPFRAFIDAWEMRGADNTDPNRIAPLELTARAKDFSYTLKLGADRPLVLQGDGGYSKKSARGQASYYYSQPFFKVSGRLAIDDKAVDVSGQAWMDREWSSQPLASDQTGWDWFALHLASGEKLMLYRMRQKDGNDYISGTFISGKVTNWTLTNPQRRVELPVGVAYGSDIKLVAGLLDRAARIVFRRDQRLGQPRANIGLAPHHGGVEAVEREVGHYPRQVSPRVVDAFVGHRVPLQPRVLQHILGVADAAEHPVGDAEQRRTVPLKLRKGSGGWARAGDVSHDEKAPQGPGTGQRSPGCAAPARSSPGCADSRCPP